jgi:hypothetical protein
MNRFNKTFSPAFRGLLFAACVGAVIVVATSLTGCGGAQQSPQLDANGQPVQQQGLSAGTSSFLGALGGSMVGNWLSRPAQPSAVHYGSPAPVTVNRTTIVQQKIITTSPRVNPAPRPSVVSRPSSSFSSTRSYSSFSSRGRR